MSPSHLLAVVALCCASRPSSLAFSTCPVRSAANLQEPAEGRQVRDLRKVPHVPLEVRLDETAEPQRAIADLSQRDRRETSCQRSPGLSRSRCGDLPSWRKLDAMNRQRGLGPGREVFSGTLDDVLQQSTSYPALRSAG